MQYTLLTPQQTSVCCLGMDRLPGLEAATCFCQQIFSQTQCRLVHQALSQEQIKLFHEENIQSHTSYDNEQI